MRILYTGGDDELVDKLAKHHEVTFIDGNPYEPTEAELSLFSHCLNSTLFGHIVVPHNLGAGLLYADCIPRKEQPHTFIVCTPGRLEQISSDYEVRGFTRLAERDEFTEGIKWWRYIDHPKNRLHRENKRLEL